MSNIKQNNRHNLKLKINMDEYWDFHIDKDGYTAYGQNSSSGLTTNCLISYIDACNVECSNGDEWLYSLKGYSWNNAVSLEQTLYDISYTGTDNGLFTFKKDEITNKEFLDLYQNNHFCIENNDTRLQLHAVTGNTQQYDYPIHVEDCQIKLNGGFYQGFFKTDCDKYQVLPSVLSGSTPWEFEFELKKCDFEKESNKTLNDKYPDNKGIFFYIGTRAENKWAYLYDTSDDNCFTLSPDDYVEDAHIDKKDYIIGNFYDVNKFDIDDYFEDYTNYNYYDEKYYDEAKKNGNGLIDENLTHGNFDGWCCNGNDNYINDSNYNFFKGCRCSSCGCNSSYISPMQTTSNNDDDESYIDDYVFDDGTLDYDNGYIEPELDISDFNYETSNERNLSNWNDSLLFTTDNKFLMFNRTCTGYTVNNWIDGMQMEVYGKKKNKFKDNLFLLMNRTCTGYTVNTIDELRNSANTQYDYSSFYNDIYNNALAFRIKDDGSIGYRMLTYDCTISGDDKTSILDGYSNPNVIKDCKWQTIHVKIYPKADKMQLYFYVDGKLVYITKDLPKLQLKSLDEMDEKQSGVPYNISLGGGTQGLAETILPNYMLNPYKVFPLEKNFAGTFIGYIKSFKFYDCDLEYNDILNNFKFENKRIS